MDKWGLGKHKGRLMAEVPSNYLQWFLAQDGTGYVKPKRLHRAKAIRELLKRGAVPIIKNRASELGLKTALKR